MWHFAKMGAINLALNLIASDYKIFINQIGALNFQNASPFIT